MMRAGRKQDTKFRAVPLTAEIPAVNELETALRFNFVPDAPEDRNTRWRIRPTIKTFSLQESRLMNGMSSSRVLLFLGVALALCIGCGGNGNGGTQSVTPTVTSVSVSCSSASVLVGQTSQCTATVSGAGSYSSAVTWSVAPASGTSASLGTVSTTGLYTAPATVPQGVTSAMVVAISQANASITGSSAISLSYPQPNVVSVSPNSFNAGSASAAITIQGSNFTPVSTALINGTQLATTFVSSSTLQATIPASTLANAGALSLSVSNPSPGGGSSATLPITIIQQPTVSSISVSCSPAAVQTTQTTQCIATVTGLGNFSSAVTWSVSSTSGSGSSVGSVSSTGLYTAPATLPQGENAATVVATSQANPSVSGTSSVSLSYPQPNVAGVSPTSVNAGSSGTAVTIQGSGFTPASTTQLNGNQLTTTFVSSSTLQAAIPASSLALAGTFSLAVSNPSPGGGSSPSPSIDVVPQLISVTPSSAPVGGNVTLKLTGVDSTNISTAAISFVQTGNTYRASNGTLTSSGGTAQLSLIVPSGLAPASATASASAPAQLAASVNSIAAPSNLPFTVQPPAHAGAINPATVETGLSVQASFTGISTAFDATPTITSDDPSITFSGSSAASSTILLATMEVGNGAVIGSHTITVTSQGVALAFPLQVTSASTPVIIGSVSPSTAPPATPITINGTGLGAGTGANITLSFRYSGMELDIPATTSSSTEIESYMPVLIDHTSGSLYAGPVTLGVTVDGQTSNSFAITLSPLPANASAVGTTTLAAIDAVIASTTNAQTQLASQSVDSTDQSQSLTDLYTAMLANLNTLRANVVAAADGQTITNQDGTTFNASAIDLLDRLLQSAIPPGHASPLAENSGLRADALPQAQSGTPTPDQAYAGFGLVCSAVGTSKSLLDDLGVAAIGTCLASIKYPQALPLCGALTAFSLDSDLLPTVGDMLCDALPINLGTVTPSPLSIYLAANGPSQVEAPTGTFESSPQWKGNSAESIANLVLERIPLIGNIVKEYIGNQILAEQVSNIIALGIGNALKNFVDNTEASWGLYGSQTIPLTTNTTSLEQDLDTASGFNSVVTLSGLTVTPVSSQVGQTTLTFNPSPIRMFDVNGNTTSDPALVSGNVLSVSVGNPQVAVSPSNVAVVVGATQQFTATVQGPSNTAVTWSVNGVARGNSTVGTITDQGLYTAPTIAPSPATVTVTATSQAFTSVSGSATVTITTPSVTVVVSPSSVAVSVGADQQFTATVHGSSNTNVNWSVNGIANGNSTVGTISDQGLYTAPAEVPSPATVNVTATSQADQNASGSVIVTIANQVQTSALVTEPATDVSNTGATLNCSNTNPQQAGPTGFLWGESTANWPGAASTIAVVPGGCSAVLSSLAPGTTYYYQIEGLNSSGAIYGNILSFTTTSVAPQVTTLPADRITNSVGEMNAQVDLEGLPTTVWFQWGTTSALGQVTPAGGMSPGTAPNPAPASWSWAVSGLTPNTTYFYQAVAQSSAGTGYGAILSFTTTQ